MVVKDVIYSNGRCVLSLVNSVFEISFPITDDPGIYPGDELVITNSMIWKIVRNVNISSDDIDDLPFPEVYDDDLL